MKQKKKKPDSAHVSRSPAVDKAAVQETLSAPRLQKEIGGTAGPEPTRYGDWEHKGRCYDF